MPNWTKPQAIQHQLEIVKGTWVEEFLSWKKKGNSKGIIPTPTTLASYAGILHRLHANYKLDLKNGLELELSEFLGKYQETHAASGYMLTVVVIKDALKWLGRKDVAEKIKFHA